MNFNSDLLFQLLCKDLRETDCELKDFRQAALLQSILKKFVPQSERGDLHDRAINDFIAFNDELSKFRLDTSFISSCLFRTWRDNIYVALYDSEYQTTPFTLTGMLGYGYCGPGASIGSKDTLFYTKMFNSPLTSTSASLYRVYNEAISERWLKAEEIRADNFGFRLVNGSKLSSVPKDRTKNRTICTEPTLNMFYQLGAKHLFEQALRKHFNIDVSTQPELNKSLARLGSIDDDLSTIDLKNASDSVSMELCRFLLPEGVFNTLRRIRSPKAEYSQGKFVDLNMIGTMGNGFTFALMTLIFAALIKAIYVLNGVKYSNGTNCGVFGDDLIINSRCTSQLIDALVSAGFVVNLEKSYLSGPFRESCGGDFFKGHDVRGIYIKELQNEAQCYSAFNRLHFWSIRNSIDLSGSLKYLKGLAKFQPVPRYSGNHEGFIVTSRELSSPKRDLNGSIKYRSMEPVIKQRKFGDLEPNPHGALISALGGYVRNMKSTMRPKVSTRFRVISKVSPCWDYSPNSCITCRDLSVSWSVLLSAD